MLALAIGACAAPRVTLIALPPAPHSSADSSERDSSGTTVLLRPVVVPRYLDSYPVVVGRNGNTLVVSKDIEWAEPFPDAVARVLREALSQRLGASRVLIPGDGRIADADLTVEFLALDPQQKALRLDAKWSLSCAGGARLSRAGHASFEVPLAAETAPAVAGATAEALGRLAEAIAKQAECPGGDRAG